jgi:CubicO group peptidase (beta-lactamase class C family)
MGAMRTSLASILVGLALAACGPGKTAVKDPTGTTGTDDGGDGGDGGGSGSSGGAVGPALPGPQRETVTADTPRVTGRGIAFTVPAGFSIEQSGAIAIVRTPENDVSVVIVDAGAADADAAIAEAWKLYRSAAPPPLRVAVDQPGRDGWDKARFYEYETSPNEKRVVFASAQLHGTAWTALIVDAADAAFERRGAALALLGSTLRPKDYTKESFAGKTANVLDAARLAKLDEMIELGRSELGVPGVAVAIVQDGKVIHAKGYGVRELGKKTAVDADTMFMIASNTKAMSTLLLAQLVDDGKLAWDQKVVDVYPEFKLGDAATTAATEIRHLVCACTGLPRKDYDWIFEFAGATPLTEMKYLAGVQPTTKFGETFQYSNLLAAAAGFTAAHVIAPKQELGKAYDAAMKQRIFDPLGMKSTTFDYKKALKGNHAEPHGWNADGVAERRSMDVNYSIYPLRPAGGAWSSANDLIAYVRLELGKGVTPAGKRIVSEANLLERSKPGMRVGEDTSYGMGLFVEREYGVDVVHHGGAMFGYKSDMVWLPAHGVGAVILTNAEEGQLMLGPFRRYLLELLFDAKPEAIENLRSAAKTSRDLLAAERQRVTLPADPAVVADLAGAYANDALGSVTVKKPGGKGSKVKTLTFDMGEWSVEVGTRKNEDGTVSMQVVTPGIPVPFVVGKNADGKRTLTVRDSQHEYVFVETKP